MLKQNEFHATHTALGPTLGIKERKSV